MKYYVVRKEVGFERINRKIVRKEYLRGIYACTLEDVISFMTKKLIQYYIENREGYSSKNNCQKALQLELEQYKIVDLESKQDLLEVIVVDELEALLSTDQRDISYRANIFYRHYNSFLFLRLNEIIVQIVMWNGKPFDLRYSYPIKSVYKQHKMKIRPRRKTFHTYVRLHQHISKRELAAGTDPEYSCYLTQRQKNRMKNYNYRASQNNNRGNIPGDWKHYHKCRKQWAKNKKNPSYEKLSKVIWLKELEALSDW